MGSGVCVAVALGGSVGLRFSVAIAGGGVWLGETGVEDGMVRDPHAVARKNPARKIHLFDIARLYREVVVCL